MPWPSRNVAKVACFIGTPLSECTVSLGATPGCFASTPANSARATSADSRSDTQNPTIFRLYTSSMTYKYRYRPRTGVGRYVMSHTQTSFGRVATRQGGVLFCLRRARPRCRASELRRKTRYIVLGEAMYLPSSASFAHTTSGGRSR